MHAACRDPLARSDRMRKFQDQSWQLCVHVSFSCWAVFLLRDVDWWSTPAATFVPCPHLQQHSAALHAFYLMQAAVWMWTGISAKLLEVQRRPVEPRVCTALGRLLGWFCFVAAAAPQERRKDYLEMLTHHVVTFALARFLPARPPPPRTHNSSLALSPRPAPAASDVLAMSPSSALTPHPFAKAFLLAEPQPLPRCVPACLPTGTPGELLLPS